MRGKHFKTVMVGGIFLCSTPLMAAEGKLLATAGLSQLEGSGGGGRALGNACWIRWS